MCYELKEIWGVHTIVANNNKSTALLHYRVMSSHSSPLTDDAISAGNRSRPTVGGANLTIRMIYYCHFPPIPECKREICQTYTARILSLLTLPINDNFSYFDRRLLWSFGCKSIKKRILYVVRNCVFEQFTPPRNKLFLC